MIHLELHPEYEYLRKQIAEIINTYKDRGENVVKGERNSIKKFTINEELINVKSFKTPNVLNAFVYKYIRQSKAKRSYKHALKLIEKGINTPFPIGYYEDTLISGLKSSYYISKHLNYDLDFRVLNHNPKYPNRNYILEQFTVFCFKLHEAGINFLDHSPGNTLIIKVAEKRYKFYLIDLNRMRFETMNFSKRMNNLRRLWLSKQMIQIMSKSYAKHYDKPENEILSLMTMYSRRFQKKVNSKKIRKRRKK